MEAFTKKIRRLIGDNELEEAITELENYLEGKHQELADRVTLQRRSFTAYRKKYTAGYGEEREASAIGDQLMEIVRDIDKWEKSPLKGKEQNPTAQQSTVQPEIQIDGELLSISSQPPAAAQNLYAARCIFYNDPNQYYVTRDNQIVMVAAMTGATMLVATKMPSYFPNVSWVYTFPNGVHYNIDLQGAIWGMNAFGQPFQMGYVEYFG
jgi:hypothetical protein